MLAERSDSVVQVRAVVLIALLAVVRKLIILDLSSTDAFHLLALAAAILALGAVYWLSATSAGMASVFRAELHDVRYWHKADIAYFRRTCPLSGVKRTSPRIANVC